MICTFRGYPGFKVSVFYETQVNPFFPVPHVQPITNPTEPSGNRVPFAAERQAANELSARLDTQQESLLHAKAPCMDVGRDAGDQPGGW